MSMAAPLLCVTKDSCIPWVFCHQEAVTEEWGLLTVQVGHVAQRLQEEPSSLSSVSCICRTCTPCTSETLSPTPGPPLCFCLWM